MIFHKDSHSFLILRFMNKYEFDYKLDENKRFIYFLSEEV